MTEATTRTRILQATTELLQCQGYSGTGLKQIAADASAPWGSLYHFFPKGKEQLGAAAVVYAADAFAAVLQSLFERSPDPVEAIGRMFRLEIKLLESSDFRGGCPIASTALDSASTSEQLRQACQTGFAKWLDLISNLFTEAGLPKPEADGYAVFVLSAFEGAIMLSRANKSTRPLKQVSMSVETALRNALPSYPI
jgi:TetR/AcrR family transcriptional regulator, lmrAB and yxaGH operons repressor